jgi:ATP-dependent protease ClpP protease subunit
MEKKDLKLIRGTLEKGKPAEILFFDDVEWWSCDRFVDEMQFIEDYIQPSEIRIYVNSVGGTIVEGMKVFSKILNCKYPTSTYVAGIAASMGSVIWAAGQKLYMNDYSLLMIHNPWMNDDMEDPNNKQIIEAFQKQLITVYSKRFGFSEDKVREIMDGKEGCDGTFLTASDAVAQGFIPADHVIETPQVTRNRIAAALKGNTDKDSIQAVMSLVVKENYQSPENAAISEKEPKIEGNINSQTNKSNMEELKVVASQLGIQGEVSLEKVSDAILQLNQSKNDLKKASDELVTVKNELSEMKIKLEAEKATNASLQKTLDETKSELQSYKDKEEEQRLESINAMVDEAVEAGKITAESKENWVAMAKQNFEMVKNSLESIPARDQISKKIADDPKNQEEAAKAALTKEQEIQAKVDEVVGESFKFRTLDDLK